MKQITEDVMIAEFLKAEVSSKRFGVFISKILNEDHLDLQIISAPDPDNVTDNEIRKNILTRYRGYSTKNALFEGFPSDVIWFESKLNKEDLLELKYINYSYWIELSNKTRRVKDAVINIQKGLTPFGESNEGFFEASEAVKKGTVFPKMILVAKNESETPIILEGHLRATAYGLAFQDTPTTLEVIIGYSNNLPNWSCY